VKHEPKKTQEGILQRQGHENPSFSGRELPVRPEDPAAGKTKTITKKNQKEERGSEENLCPTKRGKQGEKVQNLNNRI